MSKPFNVLLTLHPTTGAAFTVARDDAVSATVERSGGALLATVAVGNAYAATALADAATAHFLSKGHRPASMAAAVAALDGWLPRHNPDYRLTVRPGILPAAA